jgi:hypothetical protein
MLKALYKIGSLFTIFPILIYCSNQPKENNNNDALVKQEGKKIIVSFMVDETSIKVKDDFKIYIINDFEVLECSSKNNYIELPVLNKDTGYSIKFEYGKYKLLLDNFTKKLITPSQNIEWKFGIDNRPFDNLLGLLPYDEFKTDATTKELHYLKYHVLEKGDGVQFVKRIK